MVFVGYLQMVLHLYYIVYFLSIIISKARDNWSSGPHDSLGAILKSRGVG